MTLTHLSSSSVCDLFRLLLLLMMLVLKEYCGGMRSAYRLRIVLYYVELRCIAWCGDVLLMEVCGGW